MIRGAFIAGVILLVGAPKAHAYRVLDQTTVREDLSGQSKRITIVSEGPSGRLVRIEERFRVTRYGSARAMEKIESVANEVVVQLKHGEMTPSVRARILLVCAPYVATIHKRVMAGWYVVRFEGSSVDDQETIIQKLNAASDVIALAEPNYIVRLESTLRAKSAGRR